MKKNLFIALFAASLLGVNMSSATNVVAAEYATTQSLTITNDVNDDATFAVLKQLQKIKANGGNATLTFEKGTYHFYPERAHEEFVYISNHADVLTRIGFLLSDMENVTIDGGGSDFIFHGRMIPFLSQGSKNITVKNLSVDFSESFHSEGTVVAVDEKNKTFDLQISEQYPYEIRNNQLIFVKPYYFHPIGQNIYFNPERNEIGFETGKYTVATTTKTNVKFGGNNFEYKYKYDTRDWYTREQGKQDLLKVEQIKPGLVRIHGNKKDVPPIGWVLTMKGEQGYNRFAPAFKIYNVDTFNAENVIVHHAGGMGYIVENSKDIDLYKCVITPSQGRIVSVTADATHFVGCRGKISLRDCVFHNQLDDGSNIHGAYQEVMDIVDQNTIGLRVGHHQQLGFELAQIGDTIGMVRLSESFDSYAKLTVKSTECINGRYQTITFNEKIPSRVQAGDLCENLSAYPELLVENCDLSRSRARGLLISTPKKTVIRNNYFAPQMEALLLPVESSSWYESGSAANVLIENNVFQDCTNGMNRGVIRFETDDESENIAFHDIQILNNTFNQYDNLILEIRNVDGLEFKGNTITNSGTFPLLYPENPVVIIENSKNIEFKKNDYKGKATEMIEVHGKGEEVKFK
ncbi:MAG: right-handed parallel beta-helix repeat-containing protein [Rikenellaceae bacterium]